MSASFNNILGSVLKLFITSVSKKRQPAISGSIHVQGISDRIEIVRDRWGIPHIYANNIHDLFFAQGFVHAQDRLWQMEVFRRTVAGQLSELFGEMALDTDRASRTFGFNRLGQADWAGADKEVKDMIDAYTNGVNAFIKSPAFKIPVEFTLLKYKPESWKNEYTMALSRLMMWQLSHAWHSEIIRARIIEAVGPDRAAELDINYTRDNPVILPDGIEFNMLAVNGSLKKIKGPFLNRGLGSNSWVVSGSKTVTGMPILCNDMHLQITLPCIWYAMHLAAGTPSGYNVTGVSIPGIPMVLVGHNSHIAWGMTLAFTDCEDLFMEEFDSKDPKRYKSADGWLEADVIKEEIKIKGKPDPFVEEVIFTRHGPVISDAVGYKTMRLSVQSMALRPCQALAGWLKLNTAKNWNEFAQAMRLIEAPQLNVTYADTEGSIGHWTTGKVPVRARGTGEVPAPGWSGEYDWIGEVPFDEMPHALNPAKNIIISCNQKIIHDDYPYFLGNVWMNGYRESRISEFLKSMEKFSADDFIKLQQDYRSIPGLKFKEHYKNIDSEDPKVKIVLGHLKLWDGNMSPDSTGAAIYAVTRYALTRNLLEKGLGKDLTTKVMGKTFNPVLLSTHEFYGHDIVIILRMLDNPDSWWVKQAGGYNKLLESSLIQATGWLSKRLGNDVSKWQWGKIHRSVFPHAMGIKKPLDRVFNCGPFAIGGDSDTPCQTAMDPGDPYDNKGIMPTFRQIVDLKDLSKSIAIHAPGQSGQLGSIHYDDLAILWIKGEYYPMLWTRDQIEKEAEGKIELIP